MAEKTKAELEQELADLTRENESLRRQLAERPGPGRPANPEPRFELSAGEAADLQQHGWARSVRTGETILASEHADAVAALDGPDGPSESDAQRRAQGEENARKLRDARQARADHDARVREI